MTYIIIGIILAGGLVFYLTGCENQSTANDKQTITNQDTAKPNVHHLKENKFEELRNMAFSVTPEQLNLKLEDSIVSIYGCIVDWCPGQNVVTIVAFLTGDVSMYLSSGQIYIGGSGHETIKNAGLELIKEAGLNLNAAQTTNNNFLPTKDNIKFYLITNKGKYLASENIENIKNKNSIWLKAFDLVNMIISDYRQASETK